MEENSISQHISFRFTPTKSDYAKGSRYLQVSRPWLWVSLIGVELLGLCGTAALLVSYPGERPYLAWIYLLPPPLIAFLLLVWVPMSAGRHAAKQERLTCEMIWSVDDSGVMVQSKFSETRMDWGTFQRFRETKDCFFLVYTVNKQVAQMVPKRAFQSPEQEAAFRDKLRRNIRSTKARAQPQARPA